MNDEQIASLTRELELSRERYQKLLDVHGELQQQNSVFEERILSIVETYSNEKSQFEQDLLEAKQQLAYLKDTVNELEIEKQRYKDDCNLAVGLLHRNPNEFISTPTQQSMTTVIIPTFPPIFVAPLPLVNTNNSSLSGIDRTSTISNGYTCSNCRQTIECSDVSIQTSLVSHPISDDGSNGTSRSISLEPYSHSHMTVNEYQRGNPKRASHDAGLSSNSIPQTHHI